MTHEEISNILFEKLCKNCPKQCLCFNDIEPCEEYDEEYDKLLPLREGL